MWTVETLNKPRTVYICISSQWANEIYASLRREDGKHTMEFRASKARQSFDGFLMSAAWELRSRKIPIFWFEKNPLEWTSSNYHFWDHFWRRSISSLTLSLRRGEVKISRNLPPLRHGVRQNSWVWIPGHWRTLRTFFFSVIKNQFLFFSKVESIFSSIKLFA